jgi:hypothetical protein
MEHQGLWKMQRQPWIPATLGEEYLRILHIQDLAQGAALVSGVFVIRFDDAITDPIAEVTRLADATAC